jgi:general secretion pathway protein A
VVFNPTLTPAEFLELALLNFGFREVPASKAKRLKMLEEFLVRGDNNGRASALVVDEAHLLSPALLEEIRLLGNFENSDAKLLQIVLVGRNELNDRLDLPELWQLKQRITVRLSLQRLDRQAVEEYVAFRWNKAGGTPPSPFTAEALDAIAAWSNGIPRVVNLICDHALLIAFSESSRGVDVPTVREACRELSLATPSLGLRSLPVQSASQPPTPIPPQPERLLDTVAATQESDGTWGASQPSRLRRWLHLSSSQRSSPTTGRSTNILPLRERLP